MILDMKVEEKINNPLSAKNILFKVMDNCFEEDKNKEHIWVIGLGVDLHVKYIDLVSIGTMNQCLYHPREIFKTAIANSAFSIFVGHNHTSQGIPKPSQSDIEMTKKIYNSGKILSIELIDHIIISSDNNYLSMRNNYSYIWHNRNIKDMPVATYS